MIFFQLIQKPYQHDTKHDDILFIYSTKSSTGKASSKHSTTIYFQLEAKVQIPKFNGIFNGENFDSWLCSLEAYFKTRSNITNGNKILNVEIHMEEIVIYVDKITRICWK